MAAEGILLLLLHSLLVLLLHLLLLNDLEECIAFCLGLLCELNLVLQELLLARRVQLGSLNLLLQDSVFFSLSGLSLALLEGSLGPQGVDLALSVCCPLLQLAEPLDFLLLLVSDSLGLHRSLLLLFDSSFVVLDDFLFLKLLLFDFLLFLLLGNSIGGLNFLLNLLVALLLDLLLFLVLLFALLDDPHHLGLLLLDGLALFHP